MALPAFEWDHTTQCCRVFTLALARLSCYILCCLSYLCSGEHRNFRFDVKVDHSISIVVCLVCCVAISYSNDAVQVSEPVRQSYTYSIGVLNEQWILSYSFCTDGLNNSTSLYLTAYQKHKKLQPMARIKLNKENLTTKLPIYFFYGKYASRKCKKIKGLLTKTIHVMTNWPYHAAHNDRAGCRVCSPGDNICRYW